MGACCKAHPPPPRGRGRRPPLLLTLIPLLALTAGELSAPAFLCDAALGEEDLGAFYPARTITVPAYACQPWLCPPPGADPAGTAAGRRLAGTDTAEGLALHAALKDGNILLLNALSRKNPLAVGEQLDRLAGVVQDVQKQALNIKKDVAQSRDRLRAVSAGLEQALNTTASLAEKLRSQTEAQVLLGQSLREQDAKLTALLRAATQTLQRRFELTRAILRGQVARTATLEFEVITSRQYSKRLSHLDRNAAMLGAVLSSPVVRKFYQVLELQQLQRPDFDSRVVGEPLPLYFYRPLRSVELQIPRVSYSIRFVGTVCRVEVSRVWSPDYFLHKDEHHSSFLESAATCFPVDDADCLPFGTPGGALAVALASEACTAQTTDGQLAYGARCLAEAKAAGVAQCLHGQALHPTCDTAVCDPLRMWQRLQAYHAPNTTRARQAPSAADLANRPCTPETVCLAGQGGCVADADCQAHLECGPPNLSCPWDLADPAGISGTRCCVAPPPAGCLALDSTPDGLYSDACCASPPTGTKCGLFELGNRTVNEGPCDPTRSGQCAGGLVCGLGQCEYSPVYDAFGSELGCCHDPRKAAICVPDDTTLCSPGADLIGDGLTVLTSAPVAPGGPFPDARVEFQGRGLFAAAGGGLSPRFGLAYLDPMELASQNQGVVTPQLLPAYEALWRSGDFGPNLLLARYGPVVTLATGRHVLSGEEAVLDTRYVQSSEALLAFEAGQDARALWAPAEGPCRAVPGRLDGAAVTKLCCQPAWNLTAAAAPQRSFQGALVRQLRGLRTTLVETQSLLESARAAAEANESAWRAALLPQLLQTSFATHNASAAQAAQARQPDLAAEAARAQQALRTLQADLAARAQGHLDTADEIRNSTLFLDLTELDRQRLEGFFQGWAETARGQVGLDVAAYRRDHPPADKGLASVGRFLGQVAAGFVLVMGTIVSGVVAVAEVLVDAVVAVVEFVVDTAVGVASVVLGVLFWVGLLGGVALGAGILVGGYFVLKRVGCLGKSTS